MFRRPGCLFALFLTFGGLALPAAPLADPRCPEAMALLVSEYQKATVRAHLNDPVYVWAIEHGADTNVFHRFAINELETRVLELLATPPERRGDALQLAALDFSTSPESMQSILDYYAAIIFEEPRLASSPTSFWPRVESLNRALRITDPQPNSPEARYLFYLMQLTKKSVPQIAEDLKFSEGQVRQELSHLKLSILNEFERNGLLANARTRFNGGENVESIARNLGFGVEALRFILHYERELNRGTEWSDAEVRLLRRLHQRGETYAEITRALNAQSGRTPADVLYRTEGAVAAKLDRLDLSVRRVPVYPASISLPSYGEVKRNGHLTTAAQDYIRHHYLDSLTSVANTLGVQPDSLAKFIRRHDLVFLDLPPATSPTTSSSSTAPRPPDPGGSPPEAPGISPAPATATAPDRTALHGTPVADRKAQAKALLAAQEKERQAHASDEKVVPLILSDLKASDSLHALTLEQLNELLKDAAKQMGGVTHLTGNTATMARPLSARDSNVEFAFRTLLTAWARKQWQKENPDKPALNANQVVEASRGGKSRADWLAQWKASQGEVKVLPEGTLVLKGLGKDKELSSLTAIELSALLKEAADQMGGVKQLVGGVAMFRRRLAATDATDTFTFQTLLRAWALKQWRIENPDKQTLNAIQVFEPDHGGKLQTEWLSQWKVSQGEVKALPEGTLVLKGVSKDTELSSLTASELSAILKEAADQMGGVAKLSTSPGKSNQPLAAPDSTDSFTFHVLFKAWARKQWQIENPDKPALNAEQIFDPAHAKTKADWLAQWKATQGVEKALPEGTVILKGLSKDKELSDLSIDELNALLKEATGKLGGLKQSGSSILRRPLAAEDSKDSFSLETLLRAWARKQWVVEHPDKPDLKATEIFKPEHSGKTAGDWLDKWKASQGEVKALAEGTSILKGLSKDRELSSLSAAELSALLKEAADHLGGVSKINHAAQSRTFAAPGSQDSFTFTTLLLTWARKQWQIENPDKPGLTSAQVVDVALGGKTRADWLLQWKATQGEVKALPENTLVLKGLNKEKDLTSLSAQELSGLLNEAVAQLGGVDQLSTYQTTFSRRLAAPDSKDSFTFETLLRTWARAQWQIENPGKPGLGTAKIFDSKSGGKSQATWLAQWKATQSSPQE